MDLMLVLCWFKHHLDPSKLYVGVIRILSCRSSQRGPLSMPMELPLSLWRLEFLDRRGNAVEIQICTRVMEFWIFTIYENSNTYVSKNNTSFG